MKTIENSLLKQFKDIRGYYYKKDEILPNILYLLDSEIKAYNFLLDYSKSGNKGALAICFNEVPEYINKGKHRHTVALYYLGCYLQNIINGDYLNSLYNKFDLYGLCKSNIDFYYTWFLTCLYHDLAASIENSKITKAIPLDKMIKKYKYKLFGHKFLIDNKNKTLYYTENLIKNYFIFVNETRHSIEHGIVAGFKLFNEFCNNYDKTWNNFKKSPHFNKEWTYESFQISKPGFDFSELSFCLGLIDHFAIVSQTIMCHNIWNINTEVNIPEEIKEYKNYNLDELIIKENEKDKKINLQKWPLLFFLDLLDSIEPIKTFSDHDYETVLDNISIDYDEKIKLLIIKANSKVFCINNFNKWTKKIKSLENWMDLKVNIINETNNTSKANADRIVDTIFEIKFNVNKEV